jgi:hypothetical protein
VSCSWESPFAECLPGAPNRDYLKSRDRACRGAPITDTAYMGLTSCRWITITGMIAHPRRGAQSGIKPVSLGSGHADQAISVDRSTRTRHQSPAEPPDAICSDRSGLAQVLCTPAS